MPRLGMILGAPTSAAIEVRLHMRATGIPERSISLASVDPQRVPVPQVAVRTTAWTCSRWSSAAHSTPKVVLIATEVPLPTVVR
jgi:hypothetical protein